MKTKPSLYELDRLATHKKMSLTGDGHSYTLCWFSTGDLVFTGTLLEIQSFLLNVGIKNAVGIPDDCYSQDGYITFGAKNNSPAVNIDLRLTTNKLNTRLGYYFQAFLNC